MLNIDSDEIIEQFIHIHPIVHSIPLDCLSLSQEDWLKIILKFKNKNQAHLTAPLLFEILSSVKRIPYNTLVAMLSKTQPQRAVKKIKQEAKDCDNTFYPSSKNTLPDVNSLVFDPRNGNESLNQILEQSGVRITQLHVATTPTKSTLSMKKTPGGTRVKPFFEYSEKENCRNLLLFKPETPEKNTASTKQLSKESLANQLPKLNTTRAQKLEFTATLHAMNQRKGLPRDRSQKTLLGASATNIFSAHGVEIKNKNNHSFHLAHLIAHFLADTQELKPMQSEGEIINIIPSTAAANYNTLESVEFFIRKKLEKKATDKIHIEVIPEYTEGSFIPERLIYTLSWVEINVSKSARFYISPKSFERTTKSMHQSIEFLFNQPSTQEDTLENHSKLY